jgi:acetyl esterase/lipase
MMFHQRISRLADWRPVVALCCAILMVSRTHAVTAPWATVNYGPNWRQTLDLYLPQGHPGPFPVVVYIHGGGWFVGNSSQAQRYVDDLLAQGIAIAGINYRYSTQASFPAQLHDCKGAVRWLRAHAGEFNLDVERFAAFGESAGAHLASLLGASAGNADLEGSVGGNLEHSSAVRAVVHGYGPTDLFAISQYSQQRGFEVSMLIGHDIYDIIEHYDDPAYAGWVKLVHSANPATHVSPGAPPTYLVHGEVDEVVPLSQSELLHSALNLAGVPTTLRVMPATGHSLPESELQAMYAFFAAQLEPDPLIFAVGGAEHGDDFGSAIAIIGDVNGDGVSDFVVGAPRNDDRAPDAGCVSVCSGADGTVLRAIRGAAAGDHFGSAVADVGDVDGDTIPDFAVGSPRAAVSGIRSGRVDVFSGGTWKRLQTFAGEHPGDRMGSSIAAIDLDGDGRREIVGGAPRADGPATDCGQVVVWDAGTGGILRRFKGSEVNDHLGWCVANAGDVDGDGRDDVVFAAPHADSAGANSGKVEVWAMVGSVWVRRLAWCGMAGDLAGFAVCSLEDADGDGLADIAVGAPRRRAANGQRSGLVMVLSPASGLVIGGIEPAQPQTGDQFGSSVAGIGDIDGDGLVDLAVGAWRDAQAGVECGSVAIHVGLAQQWTTFWGAAPGAKFGQSVAAGDLDNDGFVEVLVGAPRDFWNGQNSGAMYTLFPQQSP